MSEQLWQAIERAYQLPDTPRRATLAQTDPLANEAGYHEAFMACCPITSNYCRRHFRFRRRLGSSTFRSHLLLRENWFVQAIRTHLVVPPSRATGDVSNCLDAK